MENYTEQQLLDTLDSEQFVLFRNLIVDSSGISLDREQLSFVSRRVAERIQSLGLQSPADYYWYLKYHPERFIELQKFLNLITIRETYFFRNPCQFRVLEEIILPEIIRRKNLSAEQEIIFWSAGCASGEEPYSLAIFLEEKLGSFHPWKIKIFASDISTEALIKANEGKYHPEKLRKVPEKEKSKYFLNENGCFRIKEEIKSKVEFQYMNLVDDFFPENTDVIFCRNVTMYFKPETREKIYEKLYLSLRPGGWLFLGETETLSGHPHKFKAAHHPDCLVYQKPNIK